RRPRPPAGRACCPVAVVPRRRSGARRTATPSLPSPMPGCGRPAPRTRSPQARWPPPPPAAAPCGPPGPGWRPQDRPPLRSPPRRIRTPLAWRPPAPCLEGLDELDERLLVLVRQRGPERVTPVHAEVRAGAQPQQVGDQLLQHLRGFVVAELAVVDL